MEPWDTNTFCLHCPTNAVDPRSVLGSNSHSTAQLKQPLLSPVSNNYRAKQHRDDQNWINSSQNKECESTDANRQDPKYRQYTAINDPTFHPIHYLLGRPLANRFHNESHHQITLSFTPKSGGKGKKNCIRAWLGYESCRILQCSSKRRWCFVPPGSSCTDSVMYKITLLDQLWHLPHCTQPATPGAPSQQMVQYRLTYQSLCPPSHRHG